MPAIKGQVKYENVTFLFAKSPNPQLNSVSIGIPKRSFVGVVGQSGATKDVQALLGGVVKDIHVKDGTLVKEGERLITFDNTTALAQLESLQKVRTSLAQENNFYSAQLRGANIDVTSLQVPTSMILGFY